MDVPVSRLNQRMALQLPAELPLGLVFVVGQVQLPAELEASRAPRSGQFYLRDKEYRLPCRLSERAAAEFRLEHGQMVRAGGHLVFEPALASYYLLARDIERLDGFRPTAKPLAAIIADNNRRETAASLTPAELPPWVQQMAPPEVRPRPDEGPQIENQAASLGGPAPALSGDWELLVDAEAAVAYPEAEPALAGLSDDLIAFLSQAMDSQVEVEITPEIIADINTTGKTGRLSVEVIEALDLFEASVNQDTQDQAGDRPGARAKVNRPPDGQAATSMEDDDGPADPDRLMSGRQEPAGEAISAAEFKQALESAKSLKPAGETTRSAPPAKATPSARKRRATRARKSNDMVPWYVALLIIIAVVILLAALLYVVLVPGFLPVDLPLALPQILPLLN